MERPKKAICAVIAWSINQTEATACISPVSLLYACETWTLTAELQRKIQAVEIRCLRTVLDISYTEHITNEEARATITKHMKRYEVLLTMVTVKKRKLQ